MGELVNWLAAAGSCAVSAPITCGYEQVVLMIAPRSCADAIPAPAVNDNTRPPDAMRTLAFDRIREVNMR